MLSEALACAVCAGNPCNNANGAPANGNSGNCPYQASSTDALGALAYCQLIGSHLTTVLSCSSIVAPHASRSATGTISFLGEADPPVPTFESSAKQCPECRSRSCSYGAFYDNVFCSYCGSAGNCGCQYETPNPESTIWCHLRAAPPAYIDNRLSQSVRSTLLNFFALA